MKILIAYYSRTGSTEKVAQALKEELEIRHHTVDVEKIEPVKEHGFWTWFLIRFFKGECEIREPRIKDVSSYDRVLIGSPNWTRLSLPVARYLQEVKGLEHKNIGFFATTALWPTIEWYILSAYLLDLTFTRIVEKRRGRVVGSILLSSIFRRWGLVSNYGKRAIKELCDKVESIPPPYKDYALKQKEVSDVRLLIILLTTFLFLSFIFQMVLSVFGKQIFTWSQYLSLLFLGISTSLLLLILMEKKAKVYLGRYLSGVSLALGCTLAILFLTPALARVIIWAYFLLLIFIGLFREPKVVLLTGLIVALSYIFLFFNYSKEGVLIPGLDVALLSVSTGAVSLIAWTLKRQYINLLELYDELELTRASLEETVRIRTRELEELATRREQIIAERTKAIAERTKELKDKVEELEKFQRLAVGRELKMVGLKEELKRLKQVSGKEDK